MPSRAGPEPVRISQDELRLRGASTIAEILQPAPGLSLRVNSRGETVVRTRAAEERQTSVFMDGAPLATNWDGRIDLGVLPAGLLDRAAVVRGSAPLEYGPNSIGGVVELFTPEPGRSPRARAEVLLTEVDGQGASGSLAVPFAAEGSGLVLSAGVARRGAEPIADRSAIPFEGGAGRRRANTDRESRSLHIAGTHQAPAFAARLSWLHADVSRGIAAEGHLDPAVTRPRYWRYPDWTLDQFVATVDVDGIGPVPGAGLRATLWRQHFAQAIDSYADATFDRRLAREYGQDRSTGGRIVARLPVRFATLRLVGFGSSSDHVQIDSRPVGTGLVAAAPMRFRQRLLSLGAEADVSHGPFILTLGGGRDFADTPLTGDKPAQPAQAAWTWSAAARTSVTSSLDLSVSAARRTRFASPRELFGEALGRFEPNPSLQPERAHLADLDLTWRPGDGLVLSLTAWASRVEGAVAQRIVSTDTGPRRQRFNLADSRSHGVELVTEARLSPRLTLQAHAQMLRAEGRDQPGAEALSQIQRPLRDASLALGWSPTPQTRARVGLQETDWGFDLDETGRRIRLGTSTMVDVSIEQQFGRVSLFAAIRNLGNASALPQLGLPLAGRTATIGLRWAADGPVLPEATSGPGYP